MFRLLSNSKNGREFLKQYNINKTGDLYRAGTMQEDFPLYIDMHLVWPDITEVRELIHKNGGKIFLAHPYRYGEIDVDSALQSCTPYIDGIEIYNNPETEEQVIYLYNYAKAHNLLMSAGSDYHGLSHRYHNKIDVFLNSNIEQEITSWTKKYKK